MKVKIVCNSIEDLDVDERDRLSKTIKIDRNDSLEIGKIYNVQAIINWEDRLNYYLQVEESDEYPIPVPAEFCILIDSSTPKGWKISTTENLQFNQFIFSFPEWSEDPMFYEQLVEGKEEVISIYDRNKL